jgi:hypothetical protein
VGTKHELDAMTGAQPAGLIAKIYATAKPIADRIAALTK